VRGKKKAPSLLFGDRKIDKTGKRRHRIPRR
jgi:hypothetical protein